LPGGASVFLGAPVLFFGFFLSADAVAGFFCCAGIRVLHLVF
jgi:hypothetical protein